MRILHTSDWHVGKSVRGHSRADEHRAVLAEMTELADREEVDLVLVVGDLFDTAAPTAEAEAIVYSALLALAGGHRPVVVVAGNHDNARRLAAVAPLLALGGVHVQADLAPADRGGVLALDVAGTPVRVAMVPFPSQRYVVRADDLMGLGGSEHAQKYDDRLRRIVAALAGGFDDDAVNLVVAHLFCTGGVLGGGERSAHTIFDYAVNTTAFPASAHYVALGHLHRPQALPGPCPIRYSGSPLQMDFGEEGDDQKSVVLVDAEPGRPVQVREAPLTAGRRFRTVKGTLAELGSLTDTVDDAYVRVVVDEQIRVGLADDVRALFPGAVEIQVQPSRRDNEHERTIEERAGKTPQELFALYLREKQVDDPRLNALFDELYDDAVSGDHSELVWADAGGDGDAA
jgi:exonuclease SbcD